MTPGFSFQESDCKEISDFISCSIFKFELFNKNDYNGIQLFKSRMVHEVKDKNDKHYEKSWFVIQEYHNNDKEFILTHSVTIQ